jgi:hypothetical protein
MKISIETDIEASPSVAWDAWVSPNDITKRSFATNLKIAGK